MKLVLFDLDNTIFGYKKLKSNPREHMKAYMHGFKKMFNINISFQELVSYSGKIDNQIINEILKSREKKISLKKIKKIKGIMSDYYKKNYKKERNFVLPGIKQILNNLKKEKNIVLGVLTGNLSKVGMLKLKRFNLDKYFKVFGFGDNAKNRNDLIKKTVKNNYKKVFVIGDTPHDINCGKYIKATTIAVATGPYSTKQLKSADYVFKDFKDYKKLLNIIENG